MNVNAKSWVPSVVTNAMNHLTGKTSKKLSCKLLQEISEIGSLIESHDATLNDLSALQSHVDNAEKTLQNFNVRAAEDQLKQQFTAKITNLSEKTRALRTKVESHEMPSYFVVNTELFSKSSFLKEESQ